MSNQDQAEAFALSCKTILLTFILLLVCLGLFACGGGTDNAGGGNTTAPTAITYSTNPAAYTKDIAITENCPTVSGGKATAFTVSPALPAGLSLDPSTGVITGTPITVVAQTSYVVTVKNATGSVSATLSLSIEKAVDLLEKLAIARESMAYGIDLVCILFRTIRLSAGKGMSKRGMKSTEQSAARTTGRSWMHDCSFLRSKTRK
ncbi:Ig domain-containing protein [Candidatus Villigracilis saccharophilus]|uniref:Ig domain-containing protein n=1 Tax=Candidatus Villigracilis saccharophilus TaxID=3140684 RepID=UPI0031371EE7|nr:putative Ig domain-containing protein [Anaerolineales bacterium]